MNELLETYALLANAMLDDPLLTLANAVAWLDPLWTTAEDFEYEEGDDVGMALYVTRGAFPEIYAGVVERLHAGATYAQLDTYICKEINKYGIPLDGLEAIAYGIPLIAYGVDLSDPELYTSHRDLLPILALFGVRPEANSYTVEVPDGAYATGRLLADSLVKQADEGWQQVGWTLAWLFSCSGNTLVDFDDEALAEIQALPWEEENIAFAVELIEETDGILRDVNAGLKLLETLPAALRVLSENANRVYQKLAQQKGKKDEPHIRLEWPPLDRGTDGAAVTGAELLQLRRDAA